MFTAEEVSALHRMLQRKLAEKMPLTVEQIDEAVNHSTGEGLRWLEKVEVTYRQHGTEYSRLLLVYLYKPCDSKSYIMLVDYPGQQSTERRVWHNHKVGPRVDVPRRREGVFA